MNENLRIDYFHMGDSKEEFISIDQMYRQGKWAGSSNHLIDPFNNGGYYIKVYDLASKNLIYSRGFNSYFGEYKTTGPAGKGIKRTYHETALIPFPKHYVRFVIECKNRKNFLIPIFDCLIDPKSVKINKESLIEGVEVVQCLKNGNPHQKVDLAFIGEGYTLAERDKFKKDLHRLIHTFLNYEPYKKYKDGFNIYGVFKPSTESGCDEPTHGIFKNTSVGCSFNALGLYRYLLTEENRAIRDISAHVPYDAIVILVNSKRYGGGGIYNTYCICTVDNQWSTYLLLHEFGHSFGGLADEYYTSAVAYNEFYPRGLEPSEPNITALIDSKNIKWKSFVSKGIQLPTQWMKQTYEKMNKNYAMSRKELHKEILLLKKGGGSESKIKKLRNKYQKISKGYKKKITGFFENHPQKGKVGAFEGAGYSSEGLYRPMLDCIMFSKKIIPYCKVCEAAVIKMIKHYSSK